jgi:hypothetical protein
VNILHTNLLIIKKLNIAKNSYSFNWWFLNQNYFSTFENMSWVLLFLLLTLDLFWVFKGGVKNVETFFYELHEYKCWKNNNQRKTIFTITYHYNYHEFVYIKCNIFLEFIRLDFVYVIHPRLFRTTYLMRTSSTYVKIIFVVPHRMKPR